METVADLIRNKFDALSPAERTVANFVLTAPEAVSMANAKELASSAGVSAMTISRFVQKLGFENYSEARKFAKRQSSETPLPAGQALVHRVEAASTSGHAVAENLLHEHDALRRVVDLRKTDLWAKCVPLIAQSDAVFVSGFHVIRHVAGGFASQLEHVRPRVQYLDGLDAAYGALWTDPGKMKCLIIFDTFPYNDACRELCRKARSQEIAVIVICDEFCDWALGLTPNVLSVITNTGLLFRSKIALSYLSNLLINDVFETLGETAKTQIKSLSEAKRAFGLGVE